MALAEALHTIQDEFEACGLVARADNAPVGVQADFAARSTRVLARLASSDP